MYEHTDLESAGPLRQAYDGQLTEISAQKAHWDLHRSLLSETLSLGNIMYQGSAKEGCVCLYLYV